MQAETERGLRKAAARCTRGLIYAFSVMLAAFGVLGFVLGFRVVGFRAVWGQFRVWGLGFRGLGVEG